MPGILADGDTYHVKKVLVQGWVYKKGTGLDWIGSRAWKARWACLVVREVDQSIIFILPGNLLGLIFILQYV